MSAAVTLAAHSTIALGDSALQVVPDQPAAERGDAAARAPLRLAIDVDAAAGVALLSAGAGAGAGDAQARLAREGSPGRWVRRP